MLILFVIPSCHLLVKQNGEYLIINTLWKSSNYQFGSQFLKNKLLNKTTQLTKAPATLVNQSSTKRKPLGETFSPTFLINIETACSDGVNVIICVHSNPRHGYLRDVIRKTWSKQTYWPSYQIKTLFFVGTVPRTGENETDMQTILAAESQLYNDIIQVNITDTYRNLTYKAVSVFHWVQLYCINATYFFKVDDDIIMNVFSFQNNYMDSSTQPVRHKEFVCLRLRGHKIPRQGKHAVTLDELFLERFPPFCAGMGYMTLTSTVQALKEATFLEPFFWIDDVYVTGLLAKHINATLRNVNATYSEKLSINAFTGKNWEQFYFGHMTNFSLTKMVWDHMIVTASGNRTIAWQASNSSPSIS